MFNVYDLKYFCFSTKLFKCWGFRSDPCWTRILFFLSARFCNRKKMFRIHFKWHLFRNWSNLLLQDDAERYPRDGPAGRLRLLLQQVLHPRRQPYGRLPRAKGSIKIHGVLFRFFFASQTQTKAQTHAQAPLFRSGIIFIMQGIFFCSFNSAFI